MSKERNKTSGKTHSSPEGKPSSIKKGETGKTQVNEGVARRKSGGGSFVSGRPPKKPTGNNSKSK